MNSTEVQDVSKNPVDSKLFNTVDIAATAIFAIEGAAAAAHAGFDLLGVIVVGFCVGLGGGVIRDVLLGDLPPAAFRSPSRILTAVGAALVTFLGILVFPNFSTEPLVVLDAVGLALFACAGAQKASERGCNLLVVSILGAITATGGGVIRDLLLNRTPYVFSESVYGTAALLGGFVVGLTIKITGNTKLAILLGFAACFGVRLLAIAFDLQLPRIG
ncbi:MAG: TRIC cation channel family protein [Candidatus Nanopelagicales bacterium]